jgi:Domain of unknown function (DUF1707)
LRIVFAMSEDSHAELNRPASASSFPPDLRASDADRERLATELRAHAIAGRLDTDELEERLQAAYAARTTGELDVLRRDLPAISEEPSRSLRQRRARLVRRSIQETGGSLGLFAVCTAIWAASGASGFFWPVFVVIAFILSAVHSVWELYGPAADVDAVQARLDAKDEKRRREQQPKLSREHNDQPGEQD